MELPVSFVDVFAEAPFSGNPLAVVTVSSSAASQLSDEQMQTVANWFNLSETTFLFPPSDPGADYRVRIFTPTTELPFAGHPTLGTAWVWTNQPGRNRDDGDPVDGGQRTVRQECGVGLVDLRVEGDRLAFKAPPMIRSGPVDRSELELLARQLNIEPSAVVDASWVDNGPGWVGLLLESAEAVLDLQPGPLDRKLGVVGPYIGVAGTHGAHGGTDPAVEVRAFFPVNGALAEDPVTGSLNASLAQWLTASGRLAAPYVAAQGTRLGRSGRVYVSQDEDEEIWVGGSVVRTVEGTVTI